MFKRKRFWKGFGLLVLFGLGYAGWRFGPDLLTFYRAGFFDDLSPTEMRKYQGTTRDNLKAIRTALLLYHDSEGVFPAGAIWMDEVKKRIQTKDMADAEALKKLVNPLVRPSAPNVFGYALNSVIGGNYRDDLPLKGKTILVFDSASTKWNAHGDPARDLAKPPRAGGTLAITLDGEIVKLE